MSLRACLVPIALGLLAVVACGGASSDANEPTNAKEKQALEARNSGESNDVKPGKKKWGKWSYSGDEKDCFYVVGGRCFKTENAACQASRCRLPKKCTTEGAGPALMKCK